ncbi:MAG: hypothetical protein HFI17_14790 [Lachnospiraceae bacterium]|jgi:hypothetical protein|nr:hypothetical protein [Lachnospiraceae bacterium]
MKERVNQYKFDRISSSMQKEFGTIRQGEENTYDILLFPMEANMLKLYREKKSRNGRRAQEAVRICLFAIDSYLTGKEYDTTAVTAPESQELAHGLLMSFDPFTNAEIREAAEEQLDLNSAEGLKAYFKVPVMCLIRIEKSIELWNRQMGPEGYFLFLEENMGSMVNDDGKMNYSVLI